MQYLWEKSNGSLNIYALAVNRKKLAEYREFQLVENVEKSQRVFRYITNTSRYQSLLRGQAQSYKQLTETKKSFLVPDEYGRFEEYDNGQFLSGNILSQEKLLKLYYNGFYDKKSTHIVGIGSGHQQLPTESLLVNNSLVQKYFQPAGKFQIFPKNVTVVEGIISLPCKLYSLEHMLRTSEISSYLVGEGTKEYFPLFALSKQPIKTYTESQLREIFELSGKEVVSEHRVEKDTKVLQKLKDPTNGMLRF